MQGRFTVSITDPAGSKHYEVHRITRNILLLSIILMPILILGLVSAVHYLNHSVNRLEFINSDIVNAISGRGPFSFKESKRMGKDIHAGISDIFGKIESIETILSMNPAMEMSLAERMGQAVDFIKHREDEYNYIEEKIRRVEQMMGLASESSDSVLRVDMVGQTALYKRTILDSVPNGYPLRYSGITSRYGHRIHPILDREEYHKGVDLAAVPDTTVSAVADGVVEYTGFHKRSGFGNLVIIHHNYAFRTLYGHLKKSTVRIGDFIKKGDRIGLSGNSGLSNGPHLHYEVWHNGRSLNPEPFMKWGMDNFDIVFHEEKGVKWQSLRILMEKRLSMQTQLSLPPALG